MDKGKINNIKINNKVSQTYKSKLKEYTWPSEFNDIVKNLWVIIPAYNESKHLKKVLPQVKQYVKNIIVVDDGSVDNTYEVSLEYTPFVLRNLINLGKGASLRIGCDFAKINGAQFFILMDGDEQHRAEDIPRFVSKLKVCDIVFSYRIINKEMPLIFRFGNFLMTWIDKKLNSVNIRDSQSGYKAFNLKTYNLIRWISNDYSVESEIVSNIRFKKLKYCEIPIKTIYLDNYKGTTAWDGIKIVYKMFILRYLRRFM